MFILNKDGSNIEPWFNIEPNIIALVKTTAILYKNGIEVSYIWSYKSHILYKSHKYISHTYFRKFQQNVNWSIVRFFSFAFYFMSWMNNCLFKIIREGIIKHKLGLFWFLSQVGSSTKLLSLKNVKKYVCVGSEILSLKLSIIRKCS